MCSNHSEVVDKSPKLNHFFYFFVKELSLEFTQNVFCGNVCNKFPL